MAHDFRLGHYLRQELKTASLTTVKIREKQMHAC